MNEVLQEYVHAGRRTLAVDREAGVIRGVKILGPQSRNGRLYLPEALRQAAPLYEEAKVNVNHPPGQPAAPRDYRDRIGVLRNVALRGGEGLFGDLHFNPKHALAEQLVWDAEHAPENVGLSHNVLARTARRGEQLVVEAILRVQSVDLVADPATTRGLFEAAGDAAQAQPSRGGENTATNRTALPPAAADNAGPLRDDAGQLSDGAGATLAAGQLTLAEATLDDLCRRRPELVAACRAALEAETAALREGLEQARAELARRTFEAHPPLARQQQLPAPSSAQDFATAITR